MKLQKNIINNNYKGNTKMHFNSLCVSINIE